MALPISGHFFVQKPHTHFSAQSLLLHDFTNPKLSNYRTLVKHLNNPYTRKLTRQVIEEAGYHCPEICSPEELLEGENS
jgi:hypothetical protein